MRSKLESITLDVFAFGGCFLVLSVIAQFM